MVTERSVENPSLPDCIGCLPSEETKKELGGSVWETQYWRVSHCSGPFGEGAMVVEPKRHVAHFDETNREEQLDMIPLFRDVYRAVKDVTESQRVYIDHWSHGDNPHVHWVFVPVTEKILTDFGGRKGPYLLEAMVKENRPLNKGKAAELAGKIREKLEEYRISRIGAL